MSEQNEHGTSASEGAPGGEPAAQGPVGGKVRMLIGGVVFVAAAVATFLAGDDNRWISIPGAIVAAVALVDLLSARQRRRAE